MDFHKLSYEDFEEFVNMDFSEYGVSTPTHRLMIMRAKKKYQQLRNIEGCILPLPIQDLRIAHHYKKKILRIYTPEEIRDLSPEDAEFFIREFGLYPIPLVINRQRIFRILTYLGLLDDSQHLLLTSTVLEEFSSTLLVDDLATFQLSMNVQQLLIRVPVDDPDKQIMSIYPFNVSLAAAINLISKKGSIETFLSCVRKNRIGNVQMMLDWGYNVDVQNGGGQTALMEAANNNRVEIARILLCVEEKIGEKPKERKGADPNLRNQGDGTALMNAAYRGNLEMFQLLINNRADPFMVTYGVQSPLMCALRGHNSDILELLLKLGVNPNDQAGLNQLVLQQACAEGYLTTVQILLKYGADPNLHLNPDRPPLVIAARGGYIWHLNNIIRDSNEQNYPNFIRIPLMSIKQVATANGWADIVETLVEGKSQDQMKEEWPPLMKKYEPVYLEIVRALLEHGADPNIQDNNGGLNPLASAISSGYETIADLLRSYGAV